MGDIDEIEMPNMSVGYRNSSEQAAAQDLARGGRTVDDFAKWVLQGRVCMCSHSGQQKLKDPANEWVLAFFNGHMPEYDKKCNKVFEKDTHLRDHMQEKAHEWGRPSVPITLATLLLRERASRARSPAAPSQILPSRSP